MDGEVGSVIHIKKYVSLQNMYILAPMQYNEKFWKTTKIYIFDTCLPILTEPKPVYLIIYMLYIYILR